MLISEGQYIVTERHARTPQPLDLLFPLKGGASKEVGARKEGMTAAQRLRAAVNLAADAVKAVSLTAMEALREGAAFIGDIVGEQDELIDPFHHLDAPIWARDPPIELLKLAYSYCEEPTMTKASSFYHTHSSISRRTETCNVCDLRFLPTCRRHSGQ